MADSQYCRVGEKHALAYDRFQWVLQKHSLRNGKDDWKAVAFNNGSKYSLFARMIRYGISKHDALEVCEELPETFIEFLTERGTQDCREASHVAMSVESVSNHPNKSDAPLRESEPRPEAVPDQAA